MIGVCYNLKRLLKWTSENSKNTEATLAKLFFVLWCIPVLHNRKSHLALAVSR